MPNIKDQSTVEAIARVYCSNGRNKLEALKTIGYKPSYYNTLGIGRVYSNVRVIEAIRVIDAKSAEKLDHNREIAINLLTTNLANARKKAEAGDIQAISAITAIIRELDAISNLHSSIITTKAEVKPFNQTDQPVLEEAARALKLKLA